MTTKDAIKKLLSCSQYTPVRHMVIMEWLEDINWHAENSLYDELLPGGIKETIQQIRQMIADKKDEGPEVPHYDPIKKMAVDFRQTMKYLPGVTLLTGWGIDDSFTEPQGLKFVKELKELMEEVNKES